MTPQPTASHTPARGGPILIGLVPSIALNAILPIIAYGYLTGRGWSATSALIATSVFPLAGTLFSLARSRSLDGLSLISLILIVLGAIGGLVAGNPRFLLVKESFLTALFGLTFAGSMFLSRPLAFYFGRQFATGGDPVRVKQWNAYWQYPQFRTVQYTITLVWAVALIGEAVVRVLLTFLLPVDTMVWLSQVILYAVLAGVMVWMFSYINRTRGRAIAAGKLTF